MRNSVVTVVTVLILTISPSCCKDTGEESEGGGERAGEVGGGYVVYNRLLDYGYYRSMRGKFDEEVEGASVRVLWDGKERDVVGAKPGETVLPIAVHEDGFYYGKLGKGSDAMEIIFRPFGGSDEVILTVNGLKDRLEMEYFEAAAVSPNGRYLAMYFWSGTLIAGDLKVGKELGRYATEGVDVDTPPYTFAITDDGTLIRVRNHVATVEYTAGVYLTDLTTGAEIDITPEGARTACIGGADEPVIAVEIKERDTMPIRPFQDWESGGENWFGPTKVLYYPELHGKPVPAVKTTASSTLVEDPGSPDNFIPDKAVDGDPTTAWAEGAPGGGAGESITFTFPAHFSFDSITVFGGYGESEDAYYGNAKPKVITIITDRGFEKQYELPEDRYEIIFFEEAIIASTVTITVDEVYPGTKWDDCCISNIAFGFER